MSVPAIPRELRVPGRLVRAPTSLSTPYPHGGTALGRVVGPVSLMPVEVAYPVRYEGLGEQPVRWLRGGRRWTLTAVFRGLDTDVMSALGLTTTSTAVKGLDGENLDRVREIALTDADVGREIASYTLLLSPEQPTVHRFLYCPRAVRIIGTERIVWRRGQDIAVAAQWELVPTDAGVVWDYALREEVAT